MLVFSGSAGSAVNSRHVLACGVANLQLLDAMFLLQRSFPGNQFISSISDEHVELVKAGISIVPLASGLVVM